MHEAEKDWGHEGINSFFSGNQRFHTKLSGQKEMKYQPVMQAERT